MNLKRGFFRLTLMLTMAGGVASAIYFHHNILPQYYFIWPFMAAGYLYAVLVGIVLVWLVYFIAWPLYFVTKFIVRGFVSSKRTPKEDRLE